MPTVCKHGVLDGIFNCPQCVGDGELREAHETIVELEARIEELEKRLEAAQALFDAIGRCPGPAILALENGVNAAWQEYAALAGKESNHAN